MATVLQPIINELNTVLVQLRTELRELQTDADGAGVAIPLALHRSEAFVHVSVCVTVLELILQ